MTLHAMTLPGYAFVVLNRPKISYVSFRASVYNTYTLASGLRCCGGLRSPVSRCVEMMFAIGAMCAAGLSQQTLSSTGLDADMEKLNEYIQADKTNEQSVETLYADLQHRFSVMKVRLDTLSTPTHPSICL